MFTVYCHIFPNGKRYVGITSTTVNRRWGHGEKYATCPLMDRAIKKYGWESVKHEILFTGLTEEEAEAAERRLIAEYRTTEPAFGYNILPGGDVSDGITEEVRYKLGNGWRGKHHTPEQRAKTSASMKGQRAGEKHPLYGKRMSDATRAKMSESHRRRWQDPELRAKKCKPVEQLTLSGEVVQLWPGVRAAAQAIGVTPTSISSCCKGKAKTIKGFAWRFAE